MKRLLYHSKNHEDIFAMSNVVGKFVKNPNKLPFSFYFSQKGDNKHGIRVKPMFNPNKLSVRLCGNLELHSNWNYTPGPDDKNISSKQIKQMKDFFRTYKVLFAAVWEEELQEYALEDYLRGLCSWEDMMHEFEFYEEYHQELDQIQNCEELESFVRENNIFSMND